MLALGAPADRTGGSKLALDLHKSLVSPDTHSFKSISTLPLSGVRGKETCAWKSFHWPLTFCQQSVTRKAPSLGLPSLSVQVKC
jgi:hypothetical protein